jgi:endonuclease G
MSAESRTLELVNRKPTIKKELLERAYRGEVPDLARLGLDADRLAAFLDGRRASGLEAARETHADLGLEAIVRLFGRPVLLVRDGTFVPPDSPTVAAQLAPHRQRLEHAVRRVGRVEFVNHAMPWGGTGWLVERNVVITNRHVAEIVAESDGRGGFRFRMSAAGVPFGARLDFREEHQVTVTEEVPLRSVRYLARTDQPDIAILEIEVDGELPDPLLLSEEKLVSGQEVAIIGYPAYDSRNDPDAVARYFGDIFDVKRLAPGEITQPANGQHFFMHDATTLGGNSGSVVLDLASGRAVGLHFAGSYLVGNYAVTAEQITRALRGTRAVVPVPEGLGSTLERADGTHPASFFAGRTGYDPDFLGSGARSVPLPGLGRWETDAAEAPAGSGKRLLPYTHFSVAFSTSRRIPIFTAVNIDGEAAQKIKRGDDQWFFDLRLPREIQLTQRDYAHPDIDRGHMVRREDPNWGTRALAQVANDDTFHYTNAAPQHGRLNQGKTEWLGLEDYVLSNAKTHGLRVTVFTGPVLRRTDRQLDNGVKVPEEFWKVVVALDGDENIRATGYVLSQGRFIEDITEAFVYGEYRSYQVEVASIAAATGLDFGALVDADPLKRRPLPESLPGVRPVIGLDRLESMVL